MMNKTKLDDWICQVESLPELNRDILEDLQLRRLNETLSRVTARAGAYRGLPRQLSSLEELKNLPFTTAGMLSQAPGKFLLRSQGEIQRVISGDTSGTTGVPKRIFYTARDLEHTVGFFAAGISEMLRPGEKCLIAFPFHGPFALGDLIARAVERLEAVPIPAGNPRTWDDWCGCVRDTKPDAWIGFPALLLGIARMYAPDFPIRKALISADACPPGITGPLEDLLGSRLFPHYGSRECGLGGAVTCPAFQGMHLRENHILAEIVDETGSPVPDGQWGELVITTIGMEAMPLIRYRTGDRTRFLPPCPCGGVTRRIDRVTRMGPGPAMAEVDDALFPLPGVVDCRGRLLENRLCLEVLRTGTVKAEDLICALERRFPGLKIQLTVTSAARESAPFHPGKRLLMGLTSVAVWPVPDSPGRSPGADSVR